MDNIEKMRAKLNRTPTPTDITYRWLFSLLEHYGFTIESGGKHRHIVHDELDIIFPIPIHEKCVNPLYIKSIREKLNKYWPIEEDI